MQYGQHPRAQFVCSACLGYSDFKFNEDNEVVKQPALQTFLEKHFGVYAHALASIAIESAPSASRLLQRPVSEVDSDDDDDGGEDEDDDDDTDDEAEGVE